MRISKVTLESLNPSKRRKEIKEIGNKILKEGKLEQAVKEYESKSGLTPSTVPFNILTDLIW